MPGGTNIRDEPDTVVGTSLSIQANRTELGDMFEQEINETIQRITRDVLQDRTLVPLAEILEDERIPDRFKAFFETEARWWIYTESVARTRDRRFDFSHPELESLLNYMEQIQVRHARFERDDFLAVLDSAVKLTYNYLCRPQTTLKWYVFRGEPTKPLGETLLRMDAFLDYPYFRTVFREWVDRKKEERATFDTISAKEFERIVRRIDDQILLSCTIDDLLGLMDPLFEFVGKGEARSVPVEAMIVFFDDKNIHKLVEFLERERSTRTHITQDSFVLLMEELLNNSEEEPDADFSAVYQDDALDQVVREHLESGSMDDDEARQVAENAAEAPSGGIVLGAAEDDAEEFMREDHHPEGEAASTLPEEEPEREESLAEAAPAPESTDEADVFGRDVSEGSMTDFLQESYLAHSEEESEESLFDTSPYAADSGQQAERAVTDMDIAESDRNQVDEYTTVPESGYHPEEDHEPLFDFEEDDDQEHGHEESDAIGPDYAGEPVDEMSGEEEEWQADDPDDDVFAGVAADDEPEEFPEHEEDEREEQISELEEEEDDEDDDSDVALYSEEPDAEVYDDSDEEVSVEEDDDGGPVGDHLNQVETHIDAMLERKVLKKIFNRNRDEYEAALARLNEATTWREASRILDELFIRYDVDPYSRIAIRFTDSVYGRYLASVSGD